MEKVQRMPKRLDLIPDHSLPPATARGAGDLEKWAHRRLGGGAALGGRGVIEYTSKSQDRARQAANRKFNGPRRKDLAMPRKGWKP